MGPLVEPITRATQNDVAKPQGLFAHNLQQNCVQEVHAAESGYLGNPKGVLARMMRVLSEQSPSGQPPHTHAGAGDGRHQGKLRPSGTAARWLGARTHTPSSP